MYFDSSVNRDGMKGGKVAKTVVHIAPRGSCASRSGFCVRAWRLPAGPGLRQPAERPGPAKGQQAGAGPGRDAIEASLSADGAPAALRADGPSAAPREKAQQSSLRKQQPQPQQQARAHRHAFFGKVGKVLESVPAEDLKSESLQLSPAGDLSLRLPDGRVLCFDRRAACRDVGSTGGKGERRECRVCRSCQHWTIQEEVCDSPQENGRASA